MKKGLRLTSAKQLPFPPLRVGDRVQMIRIFMRYLIRLPTSDLEVSG